MDPSPHMRAALELARASVASGGGPFGAVVVRDGEIVGEGANRVVPDADPTAHAEVVALRDAARRLGTHDLSGTEVYTSCEPCPMCLGALLWARVARIHFAGTRSDAAEAGFDDEAFYEELARPLTERHVPLVPDGREGARAVFRAWLESPEREPY